MTLDPLTALSPLDGRYAAQTRELCPYFSEQALMKYRVSVEVEWFVFLLNDLRLAGTKPLQEQEIRFLRSLHADFDSVAARRVKEIEATTKHDVKAVEYYLRANLTADCPAAALQAEFIHFSCTSEDINNLAYSLMLKGALHDVIIPRLKSVTSKITDLAQTHARLPLLALTHGQTASPTTLGKEMANFAARLQRQIAQLGRLEFLGKFNGAVGNFNAHMAAYPQVDWPQAARRFVSSLGLVYSPLTTQIEPHDFIAEIAHNLLRVNTILLAFSRDIWFYISRGVFRQKAVEGEIGSSTMPHKVNPIDFENSEGNLGLANALWEHLATKLPVSRLQRDLSDSTVLRNSGVALAHGLLAYESLVKGVGKLAADPEFTAAELENAWEVLAEAVQTVLRRHQVPQAYERLKTLTRGRKLTATEYRAFVAELPLPEAEKKRLAELTPATYTGLAVELVEELSP